MGCDQRECIGKPEERAKGTNAQARGPLDRFQNVRGWDGRRLGGLGLDGMGRAGSGRGGIGSNRIGWEGVWCGMIPDSVP